MNSVKTVESRTPITDRVVARMEQNRRKMGTVSSTIKDLVTDKVQGGIEAAAHEFSFTQQEMLRHNVGSRDQAPENSLSNLIPVVVEPINTEEHESE